MENNSLGQNFTVSSLMKFALPTIIMMLFLSLYTIVDGIFVSNYVGNDALSALNIAFPYLNIFYSFPIMLATGASAVVAIKMGEGDYVLAKKNFSTVILVGLIIGITIAFVSYIFLDEIVLMLGATPDLYEYSKDYLKTIMMFVPFATLQVFFQYFFITAGKPTLGLIATISGGLANMVLDYLFIAVFRLGISGAALATGIGFCFPSILGLIYFTFNKKGSLRFVKPKWDAKMLLHVCINGSSEMVTNLFLSITTYLFNIVMLRLAGEDGVAAVTIILYAQFVQIAVYLGFATGVAPIFSFNYGEGNLKTLRNVFKISTYFILISSVLMYVLSVVFAPQLVGVFVRPDNDVFELARHGFVVFSISCIFIGFNIFASALFTSLSNGKISAIISFLRTFVFVVGSILILPIFWDVDGVWLAVPVAELLSIFFSAYFIIRYKEKYNYL